MTTRRFLSRFVPPNQANLFNLIKLPTLRNPRLLTALGTVVLLTACSNKPLAPDWQSNALGSLKGFASAYMAGNTQVADFEFGRAKADIAATGRLDLIARSELVRCAVRVAALEFDDCQGVQTIATADVAAPERAYSAYLRAPKNDRAPSLDAAQIALLPEQHRAVAAPQDAAKKTATLAAMPDPLSRLIAAGVAFQQGQLPPSGVDLAVTTASDQGWRRPLLAWLGVQMKLMEASGDADGKARIQRRIDLVLSAAAPASAASASTPTRP